MIVDKGTKDKYGNKIVYEYENGVAVATIIEQPCKESKIMSEFSEIVCVMDVVPMASNDVLFINEAEFEPFEKLSKMGGGSLGLLTGMLKSEFEQQHVKSVLAEKVDKHLRNLVRRGFYVAIVGDRFVRVYKE